MNNFINVLEVGSGHGFESNLLSKKRNYKVTGIDISEENVKEAKRRFPHIDFRKMDASSLKFADNYFDKIYMIDVLEHVDDLNKVIKEMRRVLKVGGELVVNVPAEKSEYWLLKIRPSYFKEIHHVRVFKGTELEELLGRNKFKFAKKKSTDFLKHVELYYLFTSTNNSKSQLCIGDRESSIMNKIVFASTIIFSKACLNTPLKYFPIWIVTIPIGMVVDSIGNKIMPKSAYYEFYKTG